MKRRSVVEIVEAVETVPELRFAARAAGLELEREGRRRFTLRWQGTGSVCIADAAWDTVLAVLRAIYWSDFYSQRGGEK